MGRKRSKRRVKPIRIICHWCGVNTANVTVDHVVPLGSGGPNIKSNTVYSCGRCNQARGLLHEIVLGQVSAWRSKSIERAREHLKLHGERDRWLRPHIARVERWFSIWDKALADLKAVFGKDAA